MNGWRGYYTDTTDEQWALIEPVIAAWKARHPSVSGHDGRYRMRAVVDALFYQNRSGCQWSLLPADFPPSSAVKYYFYRWRDDGLDAAIQEILRAQVRTKAGRREDPSAVVLDTQSVHAAVNVPAATTGKDANKKVPGRKRGLAVDVLGLIIAVVVTAASVHDNAIGVRLLDRVATVGTVTNAWVDQGFKNTVVALCLPKMSSVLVRWLGGARGALECLRALRPPFGRTGRMQQMSDNQNSVAASTSGNDSVIGRLLEEVSWEGRSIRRYRDGGRGLENVLTAEVFTALDFLSPPGLPGSGAGEGTRRGQDAAAAVA